MAVHNDTLKRTPIYPCHIKAGARMVPFSGWEMPVQYSGIIAEHLHTREKVSIFDISHMGEFLVTGPGAAGDLERILTCRIDDLAPGKARYGFILNDAGGIIDDMIVFCHSLLKYMVVVNAGRIDKDAEWINAHLSRDTEFGDISEVTAKIDVQGPFAPGTVARMFGDDTLASLKRFTFTEKKEVLVSATGYTGEAGYELFLPREKAAELWERLLSLPDVAPAGLGARDSLRLEKGYSLYGHDIDEEHTPAEAGLMKFVHEGKDHIGAGGCGIKRGKVLAGFVSGGRRSARSGFTVTSGGIRTGYVTSGVFSPCLKKGIGLCYMDERYASEGTEVVIESERGGIEAAIKSPPFV